MRIFGRISELVSAVFRKDSQEITLKPSTLVTYNAARNVELPAQNSDAVLVSRNSQDTLTNKTFDAEGTGNVLSNVGLSSIKTVLADANKALLRDASGVVTSSFVGNNNIASGAAIDASKIADGSVSNTKFQYLGSVTSDIQTQINSKQATITGAATTIVSADLSASKALQSDASGKVSASSVTSTELGYVSGVTSSIQTQLGSKASSGANSDITSLSGLTTALSIGQGGTGQTTAPAALNALLPSQASYTGKYLKTDGTNASWSAASGGSGEINAILNPSAADGTTEWTAGTSHTVNATSGASMPLFPATTTAFLVQSSAAIALGSQTSTSGVYDSFTMPTGLRNRKLKVEFYYNTPASSDGTWAVAVYKGSTKVALSTDSSGDTVLPANISGGKFVAYFDTDNSSTYSVNFVQRSRTNANSFYVTNIIVGPGIQPQGAVVGEWTSYTPTFNGFGTATSINAFYRRVGDSMELHVRFTAGTSTAAEARVGLPNSLTVDISKQNSATALAGKWIRNNASAILTKQGAIISPSTSVNYVLFSRDDYTSAISPFTILNGNDVASSEVISLFATVPIAEWAGSGTVQLAQNDVEYAFNGSTWDTNDIGATPSFSYGPGGILMGGALSTNRTKRVRFQTPIQSGDKLEIQVSTNRTTWMPINGAVLSNGIVVPSLDSTNSYSSGVQFSAVSGSTTDIDVYFGRYRAIANDDSPVGDWPSDAYWRVRKSSAGAAVGFGIVQPGTSAGLVSASGLPGNTTGSAIASGYVGEMFGTNSDGTGGYYVSTNSTTVPGLSATSLVSLTLNKGIYLCTFYAATFGSTHVLFAGVNIGGTAALVSRGYNAVFNSYDAVFSITLPVVITADSTPVVVSARYVGTVPTTAVNRIAAVRIA